MTETQNVPPAGHFDGGQNSELHGAVKIGHHQGRPATGWSVYHPVVSARSMLFFGPVKPIVLITGCEGRHFGMMAECKNFAPARGFNFECHGAVTLGHTRGQRHD